MKIDKWNVTREVMKEFKLDSDFFYILDFEAIQEGKVRAQKSSIFYPIHPTTYSMIRVKNDSIITDFKHNFWTNTRLRNETQIHLIKSLLSFYDGEQPIYVWDDALEKTVLNKWIEICKKSYPQYTEAVTAVRDNIVDLQKFFEPKKEIFSIDNSNKTSLDFLYGFLFGEVSEDIDSRKCSLYSLDLYYKSRKYKANKKPYWEKLKQIRSHNEIDTRKILDVIDFIKNNKNNTIDNLNEYEIQSII